MCCKCRKDVANERRMKDSATGRYWCYDCGQADPDARGTGHTSLVACAACKKMVEAKTLHKTPANTYICEACHDNPKGVKGAALSPDDRSKRVKMIVGVAALVAGVACVLAQHLDLLPF